MKHIAVDQQLSGGSLGERHRSLNQLVNSAPQLLTAKTLDWQKKTLADQIYIAKLADRTKNAAVLCEILKMDNEMVIAIAMHATWLFSGTADRSIVNADNFISNIFPKATTHTIFRIVALFGAYLKDEKLAEELLVKMLPQYGHELSYKLLPACSSSFIRAHILDGYKIFPSSLLKRVYKKDPSLTCEYLLHNIQKNYELKLKNFFLFKEDCNSLWTSVAEFQTDFFIGILKKNKFHSKFDLGSRVTSKILNSYLKDVIDEPALFVDILHQPTLLKKLKGEDLERFFFNLFPLKEKDFKYYTVSELFKRFKPAFGVKILTKVYSKKYDGASIFSRKDFEEWELIEALPANERITWAQNKIDNIDHSQKLKENFYLKFLSSDVALPRFKFLIKNETVKDERTELLTAMIVCCKINNDRDALLSVLKYTSKSFRNDQVSVFYDFLHELNDSFKIHELSQDHWDVISEIVAVIKLNGKEGYNWRLAYIFESQIKFCLNNKLEIDSVVENLVECEKSEIDLKLYRPEEEPIVLEAFFKVFKKRIESYDDDENSYSVSSDISTLLSTYKERSDRRKHSPTECDWLMDAVKKITEKDGSYTYSIYSELRKDVKARIMFADGILKSDINKFTKHYLRHDVSVITRNTPEILEHCLEFYPLKRFVRLFRRIRAYLNVPIAEGLLEKVKEHCDSEDKEAIKFVATALFEDLEQTEIKIKEFIPTETVIDVKVHGKEYENGKIITKYFKYMNPPVSFDTVLHFAKDDYLKLTLPSVLSLTYKKPRSDAVAFIKLLLEKPVSVQKHGIRLAYFFIPRNEALAIYRQIWDSNKNTSIREVLVQRTFKIMQLTDYDNDELKEIWSIVKHFVDSFTELDVKLFKYLNHDKVLIQIYTEYWNTSWPKLKSLLAQKADVHRIMCNSVAAMTLNMEHLSREFCLSIVNEYIQSVERFSDEFELHRFVSKYLVTLDSEEIQTNLVNNVCDSLKKYTVQMWDKDENDFESRNVVANFVTSCCRESLSSELKINPAKLLKTVGEMLSASLAFGSFFNLEVKIGFSVIYQESFGDVNNEKGAAVLNKRLKKFGSRSNVYVNEELCKRYGIEASQLFFTAFKEFVNDFLLHEATDKRDALLSALISEIIADKPTNLSFLLAVNMLPNELEEKCYDGIIQKLINEGSVTVKMFLDGKMKLKLHAFTEKIG